MRHRAKSAALARHFLATLLGCLAIASVAKADIARLLRQGARVADDIPIRRLDDVLQDARTARMGREVLEKHFPARHLDDVLERSRTLSRAFRELAGVDWGRHADDIVRLTPEAQEAALILSRGARTLGDSVPDIALRSRLLRHAGPETLVALGRYEDLADDLVRFDAALRAGRLPSPPGYRVLTLADFGSFFHSLGQRAHHFWTKYVRPHWGLWLGGAALAAVLLAPEEFLDAVGDLTAQGLEKVARFGGEALGKALAGIASGVVEGTGEAVKTVVEATGKSFSQTFFTSWTGVIALVVIVGAMFLIFPRVRRLVFAPLARARGTQNKPGRSSGELSG